MDDTGQRCIECGYNLTGAPGSRCPECGWLIDWELTAPRDASRGGQPVFSVDFAYRLDSEQIVGEWSDDPADIGPDLEALIERTWQACLQQAEREGLRLYNGPMVRLIRWDRADGRIRLHTGRTDYRHFMGTNFCHGDRIDEFGWSAYSHALGVSALVSTSDGHLVLGRRRRDLPCHGGYLHPVGGTLDDQDVTADGQVDLFGAIRRELREELCLRDNEVGELVCTGLIRDLSIHQPELIFDAILRISRAALLERFDPQAPHQEHAGLEGCMDEPESVLPFLKGRGLIGSPCSSDVGKDSPEGGCEKGFSHQQSGPIAPIATGSILLHGRHDWGLDWYENASLLLFGQLPPKTGAYRAGRRGSQG